MSIFKLFSKRKEALEKADHPDVYQYDALPDAFRVQVIHIWRTAMAEYREYDPASLQGRSVWKTVNETLAREYGVFRLGKSHDDDFEQCQEFLLTAPTDRALDICQASPKLTPFGH